MLRKVIRARNLPDDVLFHFTDLLLIASGLSPNLEQIDTKFKNAHIIADNFRTSFFNSIFNLELIRHDLALGKVYCLQRVVFLSKEEVIHGHISSACLSVASDLIE